MWCVQDSLQHLSGFCEMRNPCLGLSSSAGYVHACPISSTARDPSSSPNLFVAPCPCWFLPSLLLLFPLSSSIAESLCQGCGRKGDLRMSSIYFRECILTEVWIWENYSDQSTILLKSSTKPLLAKLSA